MIIKGQNCDWEVVIGLEVHAQIKSESKLFSSSPVDHAAAPNSNVSFVDAAMPGMLPVLNQKCVEYAVRTGLGLGGTINPISIFDRKNYFYQDLPQGYQISQFYQPIMNNGYLDIKDDQKRAKRIRIERLHLEQDAGKSLHDQGDDTLVDLNRCGVGLMEIVTAPELRSPTEAGDYLKKLRALLRYLEVCDGDMEKGSMRCDANVSVRKIGATEYGTRVELKNLNSIRNVMYAIEIEARRQVELIDGGKKSEIVQETRLFDPDKAITRSMRDKEEAADYRYFPDPDLMPLHLSHSYIENIKNNLPELPAQKFQRYVESFGLSEYDAEVLTEDLETSRYFEEVSSKVEPKIATNWITTELFGRLNKGKLNISQSPIGSGALAELLFLVKNGTISGKIAKDVFEKMFLSGESATVIIEREGIKQVSDTSELDILIKQVLGENPVELAAYKSGKDKLFGFFIGEIMKKSKGKANPNVLNEILKKHLSE